MKRLKCKILYPNYLDFYTKIFMQESAAFGHDFMFPVFPSQGNILNIFHAVIEESINTIKQYYLKAILAGITFFAILLFEKEFKDAWLIPSLATAVFVIPFVEEFGKFLSLKYRFAGFFIAFFLCAETYAYISSSYYLLGWKQVVFARLLVCIMHFTTFYFQWIARVYSEKNNKQHHVTAAYFLSVFFHAVWNYGM